MIIKYNLFTFLFFAFLAFSCNPTKHAAKRLANIERKNPELFSAEIDTLIKFDSVMIPIERYKIDTLLIATGDSIVIEDSRVKTKIKIVHDTVTKYRVTTECKEDTLYITKTDTLITERKEIVTKTKKVEVFPKWLKIALIATGVLIIVGIVMRLLGK